MKFIKRLGLLLVVFLMGILVGRLPLPYVIVITVPLIFMWFLSWDDKKYYQIQETDVKQYK